MVIVVAWLLAPAPAEACSCAPRTFAQYTKDAQQVILVRAGKPQPSGKAFKQTFTVLATIKGKASTELVHDRPDTSPCTNSYAEGDVAILFGVDLDLCHGNMAFDSQVKELPAILAAAKQKQGPARATALEVALREALTPFLHDRPAIGVRHSGLTGSSIQIGKSKLTYGKAAKDVVLDKAFTWQEITFVSGTYRKEGVVFTVVLHGDQIISKSVAET